jgi:alpha-methylacyl-CoA racemase
MSDAPASAESTDPVQRSGPLAGLRVVEFAGMGPGPFACMLLSDMGADVVSIVRPTRTLADKSHIHQRGRTLVVADLKDDAAREQVWRLIDRADVLVEGFRPGVMERLGFGPDAAAARNPRLIYGRMTGWGQTGPLARTAAHELNYLPITGALHAIGPRGGPPVPPLNLVGDYGGGSLYLAMGILAALHEAGKSGRGQVVDAAISDGVVSLMGNLMGHAMRGTYNEQRGENLLDGGAPWYCPYETADGEYVTVAAVEPQFFALLCDRIGVQPALRDAQRDRTRWPELRDEFARIFRSRSRAEWCALLDGTDACFAPVLRLSETPRHPHHVARAAFLEVDGVCQPAPAPRFSRTPSRVHGGPPAHVTAVDDVLSRWG